MGRARYERTPQALGSRHGVRPRRVQTAEGDSINVPTSPEWGEVRRGITRALSPHSAYVAGKLEDVELSQSRIDAAIAELPKVGALS